MSQPKTMSAEAVKISQMLQGLKDTYELRVELMKEAAKEQRERFLAYVDEGFTEDQALKLLAADMGKRS
jgi:hypothetical protein